MKFIKTLFIILISITVTDLNGQTLKPYILATKTDALKTYTE